jgi:hypothetical protein
VVQRSLLAVLISFTALVTPAVGDGPWRGQVVDAETGQPVEGVVILAFWTRSEPSLGGWVATQYHASEEVVTGADGRFIISSRRSYTIPLVIKVQGPEWRIFKPGYGAWRYVNDDATERFYSGDETILRLEPLKTSEQRLRFIREIGVPVQVPADKRRRLLEALNAERSALGLGGHLQ